MNDYSNGFNFKDKDSNYKVEIDTNKLVAKVTSVTTKIVLASHNQETAKNIVLNSLGDFVEMFGCIHISKTTDGLMWTLIKNSLYSATYNILNDNHLIFPRNDIVKDTKLFIKDCTISIGYDFLFHPANSEFSNFYRNRLCEWLSNFLSISTITTIKNKWPIYFTKAFSCEWFKNKNYHNLLFDLDCPTRNYIDMLNDLEAYQKKILDFPNQNVFEDDITLKQVYIDLYGTTKNYSRDIVNVRMTLMSWIKDKNSNMCMVSGDPGSGKSTIMKKLAESLVNIGERVIFIDLFRLNFSDKIPALSVLESYINSIPWMKNYDKENDLPIILILDGLDEIKVNVWDNALELVRELKNSIWNAKGKIIISGRKKIINYCSSETEHFLHIEVLPLFIPIKERKNFSNMKNKLLEKDLRIDYWSKLTDVFNISYDLNDIINREHLKDLSTSPLLLFLLAWTIKYSNKSIETIHHSVEIYNHILECVYTRKYNREKKDYSSWGLDEYRKMLSITGLCAWQSDSRSIYISKIEEYCKKTGNEFLFNQWINYHKISNPSKLLLLFFFREKTNDYNPNESEIEFIHKTFYEYLSALEILNTIMEISTLKSDELYKRIFYLLSKSLLGIETTEFIEGLLEYDPRFSFEKYINVISSIVPRVFNINWPIEISEEKSGNKIHIKNYQDLLKSIKNTEENVMRLLEIVSLVKQRGNVQCDSIAHLESSDLKDINIMWKDLSFTNFSDSDFSESVLSGCELNHCELNNSTYNKTLLNSCSMEDSNLRECDFTSSHMESASLSSSDLTMSVINNAFLDGAYLCESLLKDTSFCGTSLVGCNLDEAKLINTDFADADLERADFNGAVIKNVNWQNCSLKDAKLQNVKMSQFDLSNNEIIKMLIEADLSNANWEDVPEAIKNKILNKKGKP